MKRHATDDVDAPERTLCGLRIATAAWPPSQVTRIDNADPDCKRCLRVIAARLKREDT